MHFSATKGASRLWGSAVTGLTPLFSGDNRPHFFTDNEEIVAFQKNQN